MSLFEPLQIRRAPSYGWELSCAADSDGGICLQQHGSQLGGKIDSWLSPGFAELFAPGELVVIFLVCSEREREKGPSVVVYPLGPRKCPKPLTPINFSRHSTIYEWWCLLRCKSCLNFGLFILQCIFIIIESQNHRLLGWKRRLRSSSPTIHPTPPCLLKHIPKCHTYMFFEYLQGWWLNHLPGQPVPMPEHPFSTEIFPNI